MKADSDLEKVLNKHFDYLALRNQLAKLSGKPTMAFVVDEHIKEIGNKLRSQEKEIGRLTRILDNISNEIKGEDNAG